MPRIKPVERSAFEKNSGDSGAENLLEAVQAQIGVVPNFLSTMAQAPAVLRAYLMFSQSLGDGTLPPALREQIALAVGQANGSRYCVSGHSALGRGLGLDDETITQARKATAPDAKAAVALGFAKQLVDSRGRVGNAEIDQLRQAGFGDGEVCEIVAHVALSIFTNYFNHVAATEIDFPVAPPLPPA